MQKTKNLRMALWLTVPLLAAVSLFIFDGENQEARVVSPTAVAVSKNSLPAVELPKSKVLFTDYHVFQSFNNCAPAALSIALSFYGISKSQELLAAELRPYNNIRGINDDKSTPPEELAAKAQQYGLSAYYRANGDIETLKRLVNAGVPIIMRTLLNPDEDFAHYRVIKGYDEDAKVIIQDDSYQGKNKKYAYATFLKMWKPFNYEYLVLAQGTEQKAAVEAALGEDFDDETSWRNAARKAEAELAKNGNDHLARLNLSVSLYHLGDAKSAAAEFEKAEAHLSQYTLWYRLEPIKAFFEIGNTQKVFALSESIINNRNPAYSELYLLRGKIYLQQDRKDLAKAEFEKAVKYNRYYREAINALASVGGAVR